MIAPPVDLLGGGVLGRQRPTPFARERRGLCRAPLLFEQLRDPEVEQLHLPVRRNEHVRRLDVPVHDQIRVRVSHGSQDIQEETQPPLDGKRCAIAVAIDRCAQNVLEHEIRLPDRRHARIDEMRDVRVREACQKASLPLETRFAGAPDEAHVQELHCGLTLEAAVAAPGQPDAAHAALADGRDQRVGTDPLARERRRRGTVQGLVFEKALPAESAAFLEKSLHLGGQVRILCAQRLQPGAALVIRNLQRAIQVGTHDLPAIPALRGHGYSSELTWRPPAGSRGADRCAPFPSGAARSFPTSPASRRSPQTRSRKRTSDRRPRRATHRPRPSRRGQR